LFYLLHSVFLAYTIRNINNGESEMSIKEKVFCVRMTESAYKRYANHAKKYGTPSNVARELFAALSEGRLVIKAPKNPPTTINQLWKTES
jgi:hypothetical protein